MSDYSAINLKQQLHKPYKPIVMLDSFDYASDPHRQMKLLKQGHRFFTLNQKFGTMTPQDSKVAKSQSTSPASSIDSRKSAQSDFHQNQARILQSRKRFVRKSA